MIIIGREFILPACALLVASGGMHLEPSMLGKWKATVQFVALALAMIRPDVIIAGAYLDQWVLVIAAAIVTVPGPAWTISCASLAALRARP